MAFRRSIYKSPEQLAALRAPGRLTADALEAVRSAIRPGITPLELDAIAETVIRQGGGIPNFQLVPGYVHTLCVSVNSAVVHGIPGTTPLEPGDIVSVDAGAEVAGWNGDAAFTVVVPGGADAALTASRQQLADVTEGSLWAGIARLARASHLNEVGDAVQGYIEARPGHTGPYGILTDYVGHGIGRTMHEEPPVFNYRVRQKGPEVKPGLVVAIEPMVVEGSIETVLQDDDWTVSTEDGRDAAHWEHSVAVHAGGIWVLTAPDGGAAGLAPYGITPVAP
ncbi:type I methionyl aminopeptidase [Rathayibacter sp. YIM 133350]|uniref:type I methionyl aminopeptidase n=1 Tax=Rathayibacter sp. YIM 133350 TaxID=3131992 RepID=UPI00307EE095